MAGRSGRTLTEPLGAASAVTWRSTGKAQNGSIWRYVLPPGASEPSDSAENSAFSKTHSYAFCCMLTQVLRLGRGSRIALPERCRCPQGRSQIADYVRYRNCVGSARLSVPIIPLCVCRIGGLGSLGRFHLVVL
jgi:hypothetical protein